MLIFICRLSLLIIFRFSMAFLLSINHLLWSVTSLYARPSSFGTCKFSSEGFGCFFRSGNVLSSKRELLWRSYIVVTYEYLLNYYGSFYKPRNNFLSFNLFLILLLDYLLIWNFVFVCRSILFIFYLLFFLDK